MQLYFVHCLSNVRHISRVMVYCAVDNGLQVVGEGC